MRGEPAEISCAGQVQTARCPLDGELRDGVRGLEQQVADHERVHAVARRSAGAASANSSPIAISAGRFVRPKGSVVAGSFIASGACLIGISRAPIQKNPSQETAFVCFSASRTKLRVTEVLIHPTSDDDSTHSKRPT